MGSMGEMSPLVVGNEEEYANGFSEQMNAGFQEQAADGSVDMREIFLKRRGRKTSKENIEIIDAISDDEILFESEKSFVHLFRVMAYNPWLSHKLAYLVWYQIPNAMRVALKGDWEKFGKELGVEKLFKYGSSAITYYLKNSSGKGGKLESYFDISQTNFKLLPISLEEYKNEELLGLIQILCKLLNPIYSQTIISERKSLQSTFFHS